MMQESPQQLGFNPQPQEFDMLERGTEEKLANRTGGAVTLAVGMAKVFSSVPGMTALMAYWYHFVIMFEALFILTLLETGTRVARFVFQETMTGFGRANGADLTDTALPTLRESAVAAESQDGVHTLQYASMTPRRPHWG